MLIVGISKRTQKNNREKTSHKKSISIAFLKSTGLNEGIKLERQKSIVDNWHNTKCAPEILQEINIRTLIVAIIRRIIIQKHLQSNFLSEKHLEGKQHPSYCSDIIMYGLWQLFYNKNTRVSFSHIE